MTRSLLAVAVALLTVTAGCSGFGGQPATSTAPSDSPTSAAPPTTAPTTAEPTQTQPAVAAPGFEGRELVRPLALADAHRQFLAESSFVRESERTTSGDGNVTRVTTTLRVENESRWFAAQAFDGVRFLDVENGSVEQYADGDRLYVRLVRDGGNVSYGAHVTPAGESATDTTLVAQRFARDYVYAAFTTASWTTVVGEATTDGDPVYRVLGNASGDTTFRGDPVSDFAVRANVTGEGFVRDLRVTYEQNGTTVERWISFSGVGETDVQRPAWYDTAVNRTEDPEPSAA